MSAAASSPPNNRALRLILIVTYFTDLNARMITRTP